MVDYFTRAPSPYSMNGSSAVIVSGKVHVVRKNSEIFLVNYLKTKSNEYEIMQIARLKPYLAYLELLQARLDCFSYCRLASRISCRIVSSHIV